MKFEHSKTVSFQTNKNLIKKIQPSLSITDIFLCGISVVRAQADTDSDDSSSIEELSDPNANSAGAEGAFAVEFNNKCSIASAEIEVGDESEVVSIDTPTQPRQVAELFVHQQNLTPAHPEFVSSFISVFEEVLQGAKSKLTEHEQSLLQTYQQSELVSTRLIFSIKL